MSESNGNPEKRGFDGHEDSESKARREFLKKVGKGTAAAPALALLLAGELKTAQAQGGGTGTGCGTGCGSI